MTNCLRFSLAVWSMQVQSIKSMVKYSQTSNGAFYEYFALLRQKKIRSKSMITPTPFIFFFGSRNFLKHQKPRLAKFFCDKKIFRPFLWYPLMVSRNFASHKWSTPFVSTKKYFWIFIVIPLYRLLNFSRLTDRQCRLSDVLSLLIHILTKKKNLYWKPANAQFFILSQNLHFWRHHRVWSSSVNGQKRPLFGWYLFIFALVTVQSS